MVGGTILHIYYFGAGGQLLRQTNGQVRRGSGSECGNIRVASIIPYIDDYDWIVLAGVLTIPAVIYALFPNAVRERIVVGRQRRLIHNHDRGDLAP